MSFVASLLAFIGLMFGWVEFAMFILACGIVYEVIFSGSKYETI